MKLITTEDEENLKFDISRGHRFDYRNHNWVFLSNQMSLSYSFMTFVIRGRTYDEDLDYNDANYLFDVDQYNFIINKLTCFTIDDELAVQDFEKLQYVL